MLPLFADRVPLAVLRPDRAVIAKAVVHGKFRGDLPTILQVDAGDPAYTKADVDIALVRRIWFVKQEVSEAIAGLCADRCAVGTQRATRGWRRSWRWRHH